MFAPSDAVVRVTGVEPARLSAREPKSRMSANSIIPAYSLYFYSGRVPEAGRTALPADNQKTSALTEVFCGAAYEARTRYLHLGKVALYRMS